MIDFSVLGSTIAEVSPKRRFARKWPISYRAVESIAIACVIFLSSTLLGMIYQLAIAQTVGNGGWSSISGTSIIGIFASTA